MKENFNVARHPHVIQGVRTEASIRNEFIETYEAHHNLCNPDNDGVTLAEFVSYYADISATIDDD